MKRREENQSASAPTATTRKIIEFATDSNPKKAMLNDRPQWSWSEIKPLLDQLLSLIAKRKIKSQTIDLLLLAQSIYPLLPEAKGALKTIIERTKHYHKMARFGQPNQKTALAPYRAVLPALARAARQKLAVLLCRSNLRDWDLRAYRLFLEMQQNLGRFPRLHFVTITIRGEVNYRLFREQFKKKKRQLTDRGFGVLPAFSIHPRTNQPGRLHAHVLVWSLRNRTAKQESADLADIKANMNSLQTPFGTVKWMTVKDRQSMMREFAYLAKNYSDTLRAPKGECQQIPKNARVISRPKQAKQGVSWIPVGKISLVSPATTSWRKAVSRYAATTGSPPGDDRRWVWRERRRIRNHIQPETWCLASVVGLDGFIYQVEPAGVDVFGHEIYSLSNDDRGTFFLTHYGLGELANLQVSFGTFSKNERLDLTTGKPAYCWEVLGMYAYVVPNKTKRGRCA